jgi:hypothetical protein
MKQANELLWRHATFQYGFGLPPHDDPVWSALVNTQTRTDVQSTQQEIQNTFIVEGYVVSDVVDVIFQNDAVKPSRRIETVTEIQGLIGRFHHDNVLRISVSATWKQKLDLSTFASPSNQGTTVTSVAPGAPERRSSFTHSTTTASGSTPRRNLQHTFDDHKKCDVYLFMAMLLSTTMTKKKLKLVLDSFLRAKKDMSKVAFIDDKTSKFQMCKNTIDEMTDYSDLLFDLLMFLPAETIYVLTRKFKVVNDTSGKTQKDLIQAIVTDVEEHEDKYKSIYDQFYTKCKNCDQNSSL